MPQTTTAAIKTTECRTCKGLGHPGQPIIFEDSGTTKADGKTKKWLVLNPDSTQHEHIRDKQPSAAAPTDEQIQLLKEIRDSLNELLKVLSAVPK